MTPVTRLIGVYRDIKGLGSRGLSKWVMIGRTGTIMQATVRRRNEARASALGSGCMELI